MRHLMGFWKWVGYLFVVLLVLATIYTSLVGAWHPVIQGAIFLGLALALVFLYFPTSKTRLETETLGLWGKILWGRKESPALLDVLMLIASLVVCSYVLFNWEEITKQRWAYKSYELIFSGTLVILVFEATRRTTGKIIPIMVAIFLGYALYGEYVPGFFGHPGFPLVEVLYHFYMMTEGIWGLLTDMTSRVIAIFILFGPVLFATGIGDTFMNLARFFGGRFVGGAGQISVFSSAFFGMISGSAVANVMVDGVITIPTMKRLGYKSEFAGAIEASASSGGQIMPPVMGVGAFVMAEILGIPYLQVAIAATIPAILYFYGVGCGIYFSARKYNLGKIPKELMPQAREVFEPRQMLNLLIPIGVLAYLLLLLLPPQLAAGWALVAIMGVFLFLGGGFAPNKIWERIKKLGGGYFDGAVSGLSSLMVLSVCVQMSVSLISLTGLAVKMSEVIMELASIHIMAALTAAMAVTMVLGMGMPTTAAYIIGAVVLGPSLISMGIPGLAAHMFIFFYSVLGNVTPPVCVAVYAAASIAGGNWWRMGWIATGLCLPAFLVPYSFVFYPQLLMMGDPLTIVWTTFSAGIGILFIAAAVFGFFKKPTNNLERIIFFAGGLLLFDPGLFTDILGVILIAAGWLLQKFWHPEPAPNTRVPT
ncbi:MAG: TRAP transporter fused permease subunit [Deltaproteobacteria bacterium]|nr:TRAP transporter fused permease subunit [Deltaproteobacteria bacterium]